MQITLGSRCRSLAYFTLSTQLCGILNSYNSSPTLLATLKTYTLPEHPILTTPPPPKLATTGTTTILGRFGEYAVVLVVHLHRLYIDTFTRARARRARRTMRRR